MKMNVTLPTRLICAKNCVKENANLLKGVGTKPLIVTGAHSAKRCGALQDVLEALGGGEYALFDRIQQNPTVQSCYDGAMLARANGCDYVIGIGGGSPLDAAKAIAVISTNPDMEEAALFSNCWKNAPLPIVCVGTTAGTGSEVTPVAVLTTADHRKKSIRNDRIFPTLSLGDYRYTLELEERFVIGTAVDALCHCAESFFNRTAEEFSSLFALQGASRMASALCTMAKEGAKALDEKDREDLYAASLYGGLAISVTGTALCHAMGYFLTEDHGLAHGYACGVYLKRFLQLSEQENQERAAEFYHKTGWTREGLFSCLDALMSEVKVRLTKEQILSLEERWENNKSLEKSLFSLNAKEASLLLGELFA